MRKEMYFLGEYLGEHGHKELLALLAMTTTPAGLPIEKIKSTDQIWRVTSYMFGKRPLQGKKFALSVQRILLEVSSIPRDRRQQMRRNFLKKTARRIHDLSPDGLARTTPKNKMQLSMEAPSRAQKEAFYASWDWRTLRLQVLRKHDSVCQCCGAKAGDRDEGGSLVRVVVDHIKPLSKRWDLRLERSNLQVLCDSCNMGKGNWDETDWRKVA